MVAETNKKDMKERWQNLHHQLPKILGSSLDFFPAYLRALLPAEICLHNSCYPVPYPVSPFIVARYASNYPSISRPSESKIQCI